MSQAVNAIIPKKHPVRVQHGDDFEDDVLSKELGYRVVGDREEFDEALDDEGCWGFHWVGARQDDDYSDWVLARLDDLGFLHIIEGYQFQSPLLNVVDERIALKGKFLLENREKRLQSRVAVGVGQGELINIVFSVENEGETQHVVILVEHRSVVKDVFLRQSLPLRSGRRFHKRCHPLVEQVVVLVHVHDVEDHTLILLAVVDGEVEPEAVAGVASVGAEA